jgi:TRAP-type C4-dicarboxylate transport system permease small subunit
MGRLILRTYKGFILALRVLTNVLLSFLVVVVLAAVVVRYFGLFEGSLHWANELSRFSMTWLVMLGSVIAFDRGAHVSISLLPDSVSSTARKAVNFLAHLLSAIFVATLAWQGLVLALATMRQTSPALQVPMGFIYLALAVGAAIMTVQSVLFALFADLRRTAEETPPDDLAESA